MATGILVAAALYLLIGRLFALPAQHVEAWRLAAWLVSGLVFTAHIWFETFRLRTPARAMALRVAVAVAIGAFGLAVAGMIHSLGAGRGLLLNWLFALVAFPIVAGLPAYVVAVIAGAILARSVRRA